MANPFQCNFTSLCPDPDNPFANLTSESDDGPTFVGIDYGFGRPAPKLGSSWRANTCKGFCDSQVSAQDAFLCAARESENCLVSTQGTPPEFPLPDPDGNPETNPPGPPSNPPVTQDPTVFNARIAVTIVCPDGLPFTIIVQSGQFTASSQALANAMAVTFAQQELFRSRFCLGDISPTACVDLPYSSAITVTGAGTPPFSFVVTEGELPAGVSLVQTGPRTAILTGTPLIIDDYSFVIRATDSVGNYMEKFYSLSVIPCEGAFANTLQTVMCPPPYQDNNHTDIPIDAAGLYVVDGVVNAAPGYYFSNVSQADANAQALTAAQIRFSELVVATTIACGPVCEGDPIAALKDFSVVDNSFMSAIVPDLDTALAVVTFGDFLWGDYRVEYAGFGAFQIDADPPGPGPEDPWLVNINPGAGFTTLFSMQYRFGLSTSMTNLPVNLGLFPTEQEAIDDMTGKFSATVEHLPQNAGTPTTPNTVKPIGIITRTAPFVVLDNDNPTWNLVRKRKLGYALPTGLMIDDFDSVLPALVGVDAATTDTTSAIWDGSLPGFNTGGLGPPMTFFEYRALYNGSPTQRLFNKRIGSFCTARHFETTFPTATGCAFVLAVDFDGGGLAWAGYKKSGSTTSPAGDYCFDATLPGYTLAGQTADVRLATSGALPSCSVGCVQLSLVAQQVTVGDPIWTVPVPGFHIKKVPFSYPTALPVWYVKMNAISPAVAVNLFVLDSDGVTVQDFEQTVEDVSQRQMQITSGGNLFLGIAAADGSPLPVTFSLETSCVPAAPVLTSVTPIGASALFPGDSLNLNGKYFGQGAGSSTITINGVLATPTFWQENLVQVTVPIGATTGPVVITVFGVASNSMCVSVLDPAIQSLDYQITGYNPALFDLSACTTFASLDPAWDGSFVYFDPVGPYWVSFDWNSAYPSSTTLNGKLLGDCDIKCLGCFAGQNVWELTVWVTDDAIGTNLQTAWLGQKIGGATPAGTYSLQSGCSPGPATLTLNQI